VPEAYSFDAVSQLGYLAASTSTIRRGSGILNVFSRTAACMAQSAAGLDYVSDGRFVLGLGASGRQVVEGFHGMAYEKPMPRIRDYINVCRIVWGREPLGYDGDVVQVPLPADQGTGLGKALKLVNHPTPQTSPSIGHP
jgi:alkanesulfonate monooxygenase SsuD/methylene tetrahydromethanopterin reductase-like flavin-dependent oxidoreductase (luciferase family)